LGKATDIAYPMSGRAEVASAIKRGRESHANCQNSHDVRICTERNFTIEDWACNPSELRRKLTLWNGRRSDCLARMATSEGLTRGPHPAAHRRPRPCSTGFNGVQRGRLILVLPGHFVYSISARFHVEHFR